MEVVFRILFLIFSNANIQFAQKTLIWSSYTTSKDLPITQKVELIDKKKFTKVALDENIQAFVVRVPFLSLGLEMTIYLARKA